MNVTTTNESAVFVVSTTASMTDPITRVTTSIEVQKLYFYFAISVMYLIRIPVEAIESQLILPHLKLVHTILCM